MRIMFIDWLTVPVAGLETGTSLSQRGSCGVDNLPPVAHGWDMVGADRSWNKRIKRENGEYNYSEIQNKKMPVFAKAFLS